MSGFVSVGEGGATGSAVEAIFVVALVCRCMIPQEALSTMCPQLELRRLLRQVCRRDDAGSRLFV